MKKICLIILMLLCLSCSPPWILIGESSLVRVEPVKGGFHGYLYDHWLMTFDNDITIHNFDNGYDLGGIYELYYNKNRKLKAVLKVTK